MKKITKEFLQSHSACKEGMKWVTENNMIDLPVDQFIEKLIEGDKFDWANWLIVRCTTHEQKIRYAIFAAEQVIKIYEDKYPTDDRPRKAIEAARNYLIDPSEENKNAADAAYASARAAAYVTDAAAYAAARAAADAAMKIKIIRYGLKLIEK